jgi:hypothetical protein
LNLDQPFSLFIKIQLLNADIPKKPGIWLGRQNALLPNDVAVIFAQCLLPVNLDPSTIRLMTIALILSDALFFTDEEGLSTFISLLRLSMHYGQLPQK